MGRVLGYAMPAPAHRARLGFVSVSHPTATLGILDGRSGMPRYTGRRRMEKGKG